VEPTDAQLVASLRAGDEAAFRQVVREWNASMLRVAQIFVPSRAIAEDVVFAAFPDVPLCSPVFAPGDALFVPAGVEHRFTRFTPDFVTWVIFYGTKGGERAQGDSA